MGIVGALVFADDSLFMGFVLPSEKPWQSWAESPPNWDKSHSQASW